MLPGLLQISNNNMTVHEFVRPERKEQNLFLDHEIMYGKRPWRNRSF
jgi:hypothetical protein